MNSTQINLKELSYHSKIKLVDFGLNNYVLFNEDTNAFLYYNNTRGVCFCDDHGEHFVYVGKFTQEIESNIDNHHLESEEIPFIESLNIKLKNCNTWSEVYSKAVSYFILFVE